MPRFPQLKLPSLPRKKQLENRQSWNADRDLTEADFYTISYEGRTIDDFVDLLVAADVASLVDIRFNPVSMYKPNFSKRNLGGRLAEVGIEYVHLQALGVPTEVRALAVGEKTRKPIWEWYDSFTLVPYLKSNLDYLFNGIEHKAAFMCVELDPTLCHRHRLHLGLEQLGLRGFDI